MRLTAVLVAFLAALLASELRADHRKDLHDALTSKSNREQADRIFKTKAFAMDEEEIAETVTDSIHFLFENRTTAAKIASVLGVGGYNEKSKGSGKTDMEKGNIHAETEIWKTKDHSKILALYQHIKFKKGSLPTLHVKVLWMFKISVPDGKNKKPDNSKRKLSIHVWVKFEDKIVNALAKAVAAFKPEFKDLVHTYKRSLMKSSAKVTADPGGVYDKMSASKKFSSSELSKFRGKFPSKKK